MSSYPRTVDNRPILDLNKRVEVEKNIENLERMLFEIQRPLEPAIPWREERELEALKTLPKVTPEPAPPISLVKLEYIKKCYTDLLDWEKAREDREDWDKITLVYHPEAKIHTDIIKQKRGKVSKIKIYRPAGITSDTLTEIIKNWTGRTERIRVPLP